MLGEHRIHFDEIDSTNTFARGLVREGAVHGTVVTAAYQSAGRGRLDRQWHAQQGRNLLCSYLVYPDRPPDEWGGLPLLAGIAVAAALESATGLRCRLKWPNDVLVAGRKLAGILVESGIGAVNWAVIGIGINVNQTVFAGDYRVVPTSIARESGSACDPDELLSTLSRQLDRCYRLWDTSGTVAVIEEWSAYSDMLGASVLLHEGDGTRVVTALAVNPDGSLLVREQDGSERGVYAGDVSIDAAESAR